MPVLRSYSSLPNLRTDSFRNPQSSSNLSSSSTTNSNATSNFHSPPKKGDCRLIKEIIRENNLYKILGVSRNVEGDELRRAYLMRSRQCHPDKHPNNPLATEAFQKLSTAYETLKSTSSRRQYDLCGERVDGRGTETFKEVLVHLYLEFMDGNFENLLNVVDFVCDHNPAVTIERENARQFLEGLRDKMIVAKSCFHAAQPSLYRIHDLHVELLSLSYFNVLGRARFSFQLLKTLLEIPLIINETMRNELLNSVAVIMLKKMVAMVEMGEGGVGWVMGKMVGFRW
ncbi:hypothetical protein BKA69DRAFT_1122736 [Paraphysoderma sedebokerense]|nr:hypothetical protein BKA69DRAFT_1122736 [Paraphysoderma sedebokerense]